MINKHDIQRLKDAITFVDLMKSLGFNFIDERNKKAICILHDDNKPSLIWNDNCFYCFGCQAKGDKIELIMQVKHISFKEAINYLSSLTGITIKQDNYKVSYCKRTFPAEQVNNQVKRKLNNALYNDIIDDIKRKRCMYGKILYSIDKQVTQTLYLHIENICRRLDEDLAHWTYLRNQAGR